MASALVTDPKILFLDEPTSGLDSASSYEVMNYIKAIGKTNNVRADSYVAFRTNALVVDHHHVNPSAINFDVQIIR